MNSINAYSLNQIKELVFQLNQPAFRAKQLIQWLYAKDSVSYSDMTNLPAILRERLSHEAPLDIPQIVDKRISKDGSRKYLLEFADGAQVETVGIPSNDSNAQGQPRRLTVCFSTQVGCAMACAFCATGTEGFSRNLLPGEIVQQVLTVQRDFGMRVSNVVAMGQGEPFLNYQNLINALRILNSADACAIGARHITVSTCGISEGIAAFSNEPEQFTLALSLHSAVQTTRDMLMPRCTAYPLSTLHAALQSYNQESGRRISLEYLMIDNVNTNAEHLEALEAFCQGLHVHVNLLPLNSVQGSLFQPCDKTTLATWKSSLSQAGIETSVRDSRGGDIDGACGQLKTNRHHSNI